MIARLASLLQRAKKKQFVRDTVVMQAASLITAGTYMVTTVLIGRHLGGDGMGRWVSARELFSMTFMTLSAGLIPVSVSRYSRAMGADRPAEALAAMAALLKMFLICSLLVLIAGWLVGPAAADWAYKDREVGLIAAVLCLTGFFEAIKSVTVVALQGSLQMAAYARFEVLINLIRVGLIGLAVLCDLGLWGIVWAFVAHGLVMGTASLLAYRKARAGPARRAPPPLGRVLAAVPRASLRELFGTAYYLSIFKVMNTFIPRLGLILIPMVGLTVDGSFAANAHFFVAFVVAWGLSQLCAGVSQALMPTLGLKMGEADMPFEHMGAMIAKVTLVSGGAVTLLAALSIPLGRWLFTFLWGQEFAEAWNFYPWLALGVALSGFAVAVDPFYVYSRRMNAALRQNTVFALLAVAMIVTGAVLGGPKGVAAATGLCRAFGVLHLVYMWRYFRRARLALASAKGSSP